MTIRKLEIYYKVAETLNMTEASKELFISQPSISQVVKELEETLKTKLFQRVGKKIHLTNEGMIFKDYALRILNLYEESLNAISDMNDLKRGSIRIGASTTIGTYLLPDIVVNFKKRYRNIDIDLFIDNTEMISDELLKNNLDIAFVEGPIDREELHIEKIWIDELLIISPFKSNLDKSISLKDLKDEIFIRRESGSGSREVFEGYVGRIDFKNTFTFGSTEAIKRAVKSGIGIGCVSKLSVKDEVARNELKLINIDGMKLNRNLDLVYHKDKKLNNLLNSFVEFCREYKIN